MKFLDRMEKRMAFLAVPNVVITLIVAQLFIYASIIVGHVEFTSLLLAPKAVFAGEWWRLASFLIAPPYLATTLFQGLFLAFFWYIFWMMSQTLESAWGLFRFNVYLLIAILLAVAGVFLGQVISPSATLFVDPKFLFHVTFFAFATINPNMQFLIFFVIPMKVKWLAWIILGVGALVFLSMPSIGHRIAFVAPYIAYLLFFKGALQQSMETRNRQAKFKAERQASADAPMHTCKTCGATDKTHPDREFRYKSIEGDTVCICQECRSKNSLPT
jgi:hypothetical protein